MRARDWTALALVVAVSGGAAAAEEATRQDPVTEEAAVAVVNGERIYLEDLEKVLGTLHSGQSDRQRTAFDPLRLVDRVIDDTLLAQEARSLGMHEEDPIPSRLQAMALRLSVERLKREEIAKRVELSDEEALEAFRKMYRRATFRIVTLDEPAAAQELLATIDETTDFEALARERSVDHYRGRGGLVEGIDRIDLPPELAAEIFEGQPGTILGPIQTGYGWAVVKGEALEDADETRFEEERRGLRGFVLGGKLKIQQRRFGQRLRELHPVEIDQEVLEAILPERRPDGRLKAVVDDPEALVASVAGREIRAGELGRALALRWKGVRNEVAAAAARALVLERLIEEELIKAEAARRGYPETPEIRLQVAAQERQLLVVEYVRQTVDGTIEVADEEIEAFYDATRENYRRPPRLHLGQMTLATEEEAERMAELLRQGTDLAWLARQHSTDGLRDRGGSRGWMTPTPSQNQFQDALLEAQPGDVLGPLGSEEGFVVVRVNSREEQPHFTLEEMSPRIRAAIFAGKRAEAVASVIGQLRELSEITIFEEALDDLRFAGERHQSEAPEQHAG